MTENWRHPFPAITSANLESVLASAPAAVVHVWAVWNGYDRSFAERLAAIEPELEGRIVFLSADFGDQELWPFYRECEVLNVPALGLFAQGKLVKTIIGVRSEEELLSELEELIAVGRGGTPDPDGEAVD